MQQRVLFLPWKYMKGGISQLSIEMVLGLSVSQAIQNCKNPLLVFHVPVIQLYVIFDQSNKMFLLSLHFKLLSWNAENFEAITLKSRLWQKNKNFWTGEMREISRMSYNARHPIMEEIMKSTSAMVEKYDIFGCFRGGHTMLFIFTWPFRINYFRSSTN